MANHSRAGQPAKQSDLINVAQLTAQYYVLKPVVGNAEHAVKFGTSGHRGSAARHSFNEPHILAIAQAIAEERAKNGVTGPCYVGKDTHALSEPAFISVLEVLAANGVDVTRNGEVLVTMSYRITDEGAELRDTDGTVYPVVYSPADDTLTISGNGYTEVAKRGTNPKPAEN